MAALGRLATGEENPDHIALSCMPPELHELLRSESIDGRYKIDLNHLPLFHLSGDFDGDGKTDFAVRLEHKAEKKEAEDECRLVVLHGTGLISWLDRDEKLQYPILPAWYVYPRSVPVGKGAEGGGVTGWLEVGVLASLRVCEISTRTCCRCRTTCGAWVRLFVFVC